MKKKYCTYSLPSLIKKSFVRSFSLSLYIYIFIYFSLQNQVEDEDHFLLVCPLYTDLRNIFLELKSIQSLQNILRRKTTKGCRLLSKFNFHAINRRKLYVDV